MQGNGAAVVRSSGSEKQLQTQSEPETSETLPQNVSMRLLGLMKEVVAKDITPDTVRAACLCASEIHKMLKLNLEIKRSLK